MTDQANIAHRHWIALHEMGFGVDDIAKNGERGVMRYIAEHTPQEVIALDVGANVGVYAELLFYAFRQADKRGTIYCLEPSSDVFPELTGRVDGLFGGEGISVLEVETHQVALHQIRTTLPLFKVSNKKGDYSGLSSLYARDLSHLGIEMEDYERVETDTLDLFCGTKIPHIHFLKLDVEGHELNVLKGAPFMLPFDCIDYIQFEFGGCNIDSRTYFKDFWYLLSPQYHLYRVTPSGLVLIPEYAEVHEVFLTVNYLAIGKHVQPEPEEYIGTYP